MSISGIRYPKPTRQVHALFRPKASAAEDRIKALEAVGAEVLETLKREG